MFEIKGNYTTAKVMIDNVEESCIAQITQFVNHPAFTNPVVIMPDCHAGKSAVVGFTMKLSNKIIPNTVGVDLNCGMRSVCIGKNLSMSLELIDHKIRQRIPFGFETHDKPVINLKNEFPWKSLNVLAQKFILAYQNKFNNIFEYDEFNDRNFMNILTRIGANASRVLNSIGTLGGG